MPKSTGISHVPPEQPLLFPTPDPADKDAVRPQTGQSSPASEKSLPLGRREVDSSSAVPLVNPKAAEIRHLEKQYVSQCDYLAKLQEKQVIFQQLDAIRSSIADPKNFDVAGGFAITFVANDGRKISVLPPDPGLSEQDLGSLLGRLSGLVGQSGNEDVSGELEEVFGKGGQMLEESLIEVQQEMEQCRVELGRLAPQSEALSYQPEPVTEYELSPVLLHWGLARPAESAKTSDGQFFFTAGKYSPEPSIPDESLPAEPGAVSAAGSSPETTSHHDNLMRRIQEDNLFEPDVAREILDANKPQVSRGDSKYMGAPNINHLMYDLGKDKKSNMVVHLETSGQKQTIAWVQGILESWVKNLKVRLGEAAGKDLTDAQVMNMIYTTLFISGFEQADQDIDFAILLTINNTRWLINRRHSRNIRTLCCAHQQSEHSGIMELQVDNTDPAVADRLAKAIHQVDPVDPEVLEQMRRLPAVTKLPSSSDVGGYYLLFEGSCSETLMSDKTKGYYFQNRENKDPNDVVDALQEELDIRADGEGLDSTAFVMNVP